MPGAAGGLGDIGFSYSTTKHCDGGARQARADGRRTPMFAAYKAKRAACAALPLNVLPCAG